MTAQRVADYAARTRVEGATRRLAILAQGRRVRRRPRNDEEARILSRMARSAIRERLASGRLERLGPREYVLHPSVADASVRERD